MPLGPAVGGIQMIPGGQCNAKFADLAERLRMAGQLAGRLRGTGPPPVLSLCRRKRKF